MGPTLEFSEAIHAEKYRGKNETFKEAMNRIAGTLEDSEEHFHGFRDALLDMRFMPGGRIQAAIGSKKNVTAFNCFVSGRIEDSFVEGHGSIMQIATEAATTMRMGGGIGYDFSTLRPRGDLIRKLQSSSSGPVSFMEIYDAICRCISSSGHRRGAQMGVMRVDHPDIEEFVRCKQPPAAVEPILRKLAECEAGTVEWREWHKALQAVYRLTGFNISVAVTDEFMRAVRDKESFTLRFGGKSYQEIDARVLWDTIMRSAWDWAEPGIIFIDTVNRMNNQQYYERIIATNPCGEQPLPAYGACLLGSFNLVKYLLSSGPPWFNRSLLIQDIHHVVRAMDNVIDNTTYPLYEQEKAAKATRRMGLGVTGLANAIEFMGYPYGSAEFVDVQAEILSTLAENCYRASVELAIEKGPFPLYKRDKYCDSEFIKSLSSTTQDLIRQNGIRNSHLLSIAPTGTISLCADNVSSSIEPVFALEQKRLVNMPDGATEFSVDDYGYRVLGVEGKTADQVTIDEHLAVLACASKFVDSAVSKTCNVPSDTPWPEFKELYMRAWELGCKGITTYQVGGKRSGIISTAKKGASCRLDTKSGRRECD
jgi:ribonucleoside-diphosphate reductase alpha chain